MRWPCAWRVVEHGTVRSYRLFPGERFKLDLPADSGSSFVEHVPSALRLLYTPPGGQPAELVVDLDMYEMLMRLNDGYRPTLEEHQGHYLTLAVFKNVLSSAPYPGGAPHPNRARLLPDRPQAERRPVPRGD